MAIELSVGQVSGLIALAIFIVQLYIPNLFVLILSAILGSENTATSWSVAARTVQSSNWPQLLRNEGAATTRTGWRVIVLTAAPTILLMGLSVAGVVTPLGLHNGVSEVNYHQLDFRYIPDQSRLAVSTLHSNASKLNRLCLYTFTASEHAHICPEAPNKLVQISNNPAVAYYNLTGNNGTLSIEIPPVLRERFTSGSKTVASTVSNVFDIQWRTHEHAQKDLTNNNRPFLVGGFRMLEPKILEKSIYLVEGLLVDPVRGGIAFRNHTAPVGYERGATWSEDLLFFEPQTRCVNLNLTLEHEQPKKNTLDTLDLRPIYLRDRGGFDQLVGQRDLSAQEIEFNDVDLVARATNAGRAHNKLLANALKLTQSRNDQITNVKSHTGKDFDTKNEESPTGFFLQLDEDMELVFEAFSNLFITTAIGIELENIVERCQNYTYDYKTYEYQSYSIGIACGIMRGAPHLAKEQNTPKSSHYSTPLYSCATSIAADIKRVYFSVADAEVSSIELIKVLNITDKVYTESSPPPLWGIERLDIPLYATLPTWGIIDEEMAKGSDVLSVRKPSLNLPGAVLDGGSYLGYGTARDNFPGIEFVTQSLTSTYLANENAGLDLDGNGDNTYLLYYTGAMSGALHDEYVHLSMSASTAGTIPNRIWTDLAANAVMGTRGVLGPQNNLTYLTYGGRAFNNAVKINYLYAIPSFIVAVAVLVFSVIAIFTVATGATGLVTLRRIVRQTSVGRVLTATSGAKGGTLAAKESEWIDSAGSHVYDLSGDAPKSLTAPGSEAEKLLAGQGLVQGEDQKQNLTSTEKAAAKDGYR